MYGGGLFKPCRTPVSYCASVEAGLQAVDRRTSDVLKERKAEAETLNPRDRSFCASEKVKVAPTRALAALSVMPATEKAAYMELLARVVIASGVLRTKLEVVVSA
jgi:hypothetical protein